jgi:hypothetical protein
LGVAPRCTYFPQLVFNPYVPTGLGALLEAQAWAAASAPPQLLLAVAWALPALHAWPEAGELIAVGCALSVCVYY